MIKHIVDEIKSSPIKTIVAVIGLIITLTIFLHYGEDSNEELFTDEICTKASDCPEGQVCDDGICTFVDEICTKDSDCPEGQVCDDGICQDW